MLRGRFLDGDTVTSFCGSVSVVGPSWSLVAVDVAVANMASSGETVRTVGLAAVDGLTAVTEGLAVDGLAVDGLAVDGLAVGLAHGGFQNTGSRGVAR